MSATPLSDAALDQLFRSARSHNKWQPKPVADTTLKALYELMKMGPTSANCCPARIVFLRTKEAKERLAPALSSGNLAKTMEAPAVAIIGYDLDFTEKMLTLFPHKPEAKHWFGSGAVLEATAFRNSSLQGAYFILAARSLGLDTGPMSGFDPAKVDAEFFPGGRVKVNFICNLGYGDPSGVFDRLPRLPFAEACQLL